MPGEPDLLRPPSRRFPRASRSAFEVAVMSASGRSCGVVNCPSDLMPLASDHRGPGRLRLIAGTRCPVEADQGCDRGLALFAICGGIVVLFTDEKDIAFRRVR